MKREIAILIISLTTLGVAWGQNFEVSFNRNTEHMKPGYSYTSGVSGEALDFSSVARFREPIRIDSAAINLSTDFTMVIWVKSQAGVVDSKDIVNSIDYKGRRGGFVLGASADGSWYGGVGNGTSTLWYEPTASRQPINDGLWHMLALSFNRVDSEVRFYYDGMNVAIYNTSELGNFTSRGDLFLGGREASESGSFNGFMDKFSIFNALLSPEEMFALYASHIKGSKLPRAEQRIDSTRILEFNIWNGGRTHGDKIGVERVVEVIRTSGADIIGMIETYGSGAKIADALGYYLYLHSSNLSIISRYPIERTYDFFKPFNCAAATIAISKTQKINYINLWLHYLPSTAAQIKEALSPEVIAQQEWDTRAGELKQILSDAKPLTESQTPLFISGDFNIGSHLDWSEQNRDLHEGYAVRWPTSVMMEQAGFLDSYRVVNPDVRKAPGMTWSPQFKDELQYRIDFIYYRGEGVEPIRSVMIDQHPVRYPSDHAAVMTTFVLPR